MLTDSQRAGPPEHSTRNVPTSPVTDGGYVGEDTMRELYAEHGKALLIDAARAANARPALTEDIWSSEPAVDGGLDGLLNRSMLVDAMRRLSPVHQQIVIETFLLDNPMHLTAVRLGVPAGTVRSRLHYALSQLRRHGTRLHRCLRTRSVSAS